MPVGAEIKKYAHASGRTQAYLSKKTGMSLPKLSLALNDKRKITLEEYELLCGALEVSPDRFLTPRLPEQKS